MPWDKTGIGFDCARHDATGRWVKGAAGCIPAGSVHRTELFAIWRGLSLARECGCRQLVCETECLDAFFMVTSHLHEPSLAEDADLLVQIRDLLQLSWEVQFSIIPRESNSVADALAKMGAYNLAGAEEWLDLPLELYEILNREASTMAC